MAVVNLCDGVSCICIRCDVIVWVHHVMSSDACEGKVATVLLMEGTLQIGQPYHAV